MHKGFALSLAANVCLLVLLQFAWDQQRGGATPPPPPSAAEDFAATADTIGADGIDAVKQPTPVMAASPSVPSPSGVGSKELQHPSHIPVFQSPIGSVAHGGTAHLAFVDQLWPLRMGRAFINSSHETVVQPVLQVPPDVRRICIDVGTYLQSPTAKLWWSRDPATFVVAFEPNKFSVALMTRLAHPIMMSQMTGYWPFCMAAGAGRNKGLEERLDRMAAGAGKATAAVALNVTEDNGDDEARRTDGTAAAASSQKEDDATSTPNSGASPSSSAAVSYSMIQDCVFQMWGHITSHTDRFLLIPVALSATDYFSSFQVGLKNRADMGSLLNFKKSIKKKKGIAHEQEDRILASVSRLSHILQLLPSHEETSGNPILWDTLKIDAQGVDSLIIAGAGPLLAHFVCIIGEFDTRAYDTNQVFRYRQYLKDLLFVRAGQTVFVNLRYAQLFLKKMVICKAPDLKTRWHRMATVVREALKISRRAGGLKVLVNQSMT